MNKEEFVRWNERMFVKYNNERLYRHPNPAISYIEARRLSIILDEAAGAERVADIGCGEGHILCRLSSPLVVGADLSQTALERASVCSRAILARADAEALPFAGSFFDVAICSETLEHTRNPRKVLLELRRIVKPGGKIILSVPNEPLINRIKDLFWNLGLFHIVFPHVPRRQDEEWHLHSFDLGMLKRLCRGILSIRSIRPVPLALFPIRYVLVCSNAKKSPPRTKRLFSRTGKRKERYLDFL